MKQAAIISIFLLSLTGSVLYSQNAAKIVPFQRPVGKLKKDVALLVRFEQELTTADIEKRVKAPDFVFESALYRACMKRALIKSRTIRRVAAVTCERSTDEEDTSWWCCGESGVSICEPIANKSRGKR